MDTVGTARTSASNCRIQIVMPAEAGIQETRNEPWIPVCTGMTAMDSREQMWGMTNFLRHVPGGRTSIKLASVPPSKLQTLLFRNLLR
jgi:hypothetical protein